MKKISYLIVFLLLIGMVNAVEVCVVADYNNGNIDSKCVDVADGSSGYDALQATGWDLLWTPESMYGRMLCKINGIGEDLDGQWCAYNGKYWNFDTLSDRKWNHMMVGLSSYSAKEGDIIGLTFGPDLSHPNLIKIDEVKAYVDGDKKSGADEDGGKIKDVKPGSKIELKIKIKNPYDTDSDITLEGVTATGTISDIDDGDEIEEESDDVDIDAGRTKTIKLEFEIPLEVENEEFDLDLVIEAEDSEGIEYEKTIKYTVDVEKEKHKIEFNRVELLKTELKCVRTTSLAISVMNLGREEEDVTLKIINHELELNKQISFTLSEEPFDDDSKYTANIPITISNEAEAGNYPLSIQAEYNDGSDYIEKIIDLTISECKSDEANEEESEGIEETETLITTQQSLTLPQTTTPVTGLTVVEPTTQENTEEDFFKKNMALIIAAAIGFVAIVGVGVVLLVKFL